MPIIHKITLSGQAAPAAQIRFGTLNTSGTGAAPIAEPDGDYGDFTVSGGIITPNTTPTAGTEIIGDTTIEIVDRLFAAASEQEAIDREPWLLSTLTDPDYTVLFRAGVRVSTTDLNIFGGGFPRPSPLTIYGTVTIEGEMVDGAPAAIVDKCRISAVVANVDGNGFVIKNFKTESLSEEDDVTWCVMQRMDTVDFTVSGCEFFGNEYDINGDYGALIDYEGLTGAFTVGEDLDSPDFAGVTNRRRRIMDVRDNGDGTGTLRCHDGTEFGQATNRLRDIALSSTMTGVTSGASATCSRVGYTKRPTNPPFIGVTGGPSVKRFTLEDCRLFDTGADAVVVRVNGPGEINYLNNSVTRYFSDAFKISPANGGGANPKIRFIGNDILHPVGIASDLGNPHSDAFQVTVGSDLYDWVDAEVMFNRTLGGDARGAAQGLFLQNEARWVNLIQAGNVLADWSAVNQVFMHGESNHTYNNSVVKLTDASGNFRDGSNRPTFFIQGTETSRGEFNTSLNAKDQGAGVLTNDNLFVFLDGFSTGTDPLDIYAGKATGAPFHIRTFEEMDEALKPAATADQRIGAYGTPVDRENQTIDPAHLMGLP